MEDPPRLKVASVEPSITYACSACGEKFEDIQSASDLRVMRIRKSILKFGGISLQLEK